MNIRKHLVLAAFALALIAPKFSVAQATPASQEDPVASERGAKHDLRQSEKESGEDENAAMRHSAPVKMLGKMLGMEPEPAAKLFTWINFMVLAGAIGWFLAKNLPKTFRSRTSGIEKNLVEARTATESANIRLASVEERLAKLDGEIAAIRAQAESDAAKDEQRIKASVEEEKQKILAAAEQEISAATAQAQRQIRQYAAEMAIDQAAARLQVSADMDRQLIEDFASRLGGRGGEN